MTVLQANDGKQTLDGKLAAAISLPAGGFPLLGSIASGLTGLIGLAGLWAYWRGHLRPARSTFTTCMTAAIVLYILSALLSLAMHPSDSGNQNQFLMRLAFLWFLPLASLIALLPPAHIVKTVEIAACIGAMAAGLIAVLEVVFFRERAWGNAGNPGPYALIVSVQYAICVLALGNKGPKEQMFFAAGAAAAAWCILASGMRSFLPVIVLFPALLAVPAIARTGKEKRFGAGGRQAVFLIAILAISLVMVLSHERIWALHNELSMVFSGVPSDTSLGHRHAMLLYANEHLTDAWPLGIGQSAAMAGLETYTAFNFGFSLEKTHLHNVFLTAYFRGGILDLATTTLFILALPLCGFIHWLSGEGGFHWRLASAVWLPYLLGSQLNLALGHDVLDHFHVFMLAVIAALSSSGNRLRTGKG